MLFWSVQAALASQLFEHVMVSTEDEEIAQISLKAGAEVPFLRNRYSGDQDSAAQATAYMVSKAEKHWHCTFDTVVQLMACCPLRGASDICQAVDSFESKERNFQLSCVEIKGLQPWWLARKTSEKNFAFLFEDALNGSIDVSESLYCPSGAIWIAKKSLLDQYQTFYGPDWVFEPVHYLAGLDIDTQDDFDFVNSFLPFKKQIHPYV